MQRRTATVYLLGLLILSSGCLSRPPAPPRKEDVAKPPENQQFEPGPTDEDAETEFTETPSGLQYRILRKSDGPKPTTSDRVTCHYKGWTNSGTVFDSSYRTGDPVTFPLNGVIKGWTEGLQLIGVGGMIELKIPYELGYGEQGQGPIPPKTDLNFIVELLEIP